MPRDELDRIKEQHAAEREAVEAQRARIDQQHQQREEEINAEAERRQEARQRDADQLHDSFEDALEAKLSETGRALADRIEEELARRQEEREQRQEAERRQREDQMREAERQRDYEAAGYKVERTPDEEDRRHQYHAEHGESEARGRTMDEAARSAREVEHERQQMDADRGRASKFSDEQRAYWQEQHQRDR